MNDIACLNESCIDEVVELKFKIIDQQKEIDRLKKREEKLCKALRFYADKVENTNYEEFMGVNSWRFDDGDMAKEALKELEGQG